MRSFFLAATPSKAVVRHVGARIPQNAAAWHDAPSALRAQDAGDDRVDGEDLEDNEDRGASPDGAGVTNKLSRISTQASMDASVLLWMVLFVTCVTTWMCYKLQSASVQVVVARYAEDLSWLCEPPFEEFGDVVVYDKGAAAGRIPDHAKVVRLPNVGREGHTYLTHILRNYDSLADVTIFVLGSCRHNVHKWARAKWVAGHVQSTGSSAFPDAALPMGLWAAQGNFTIRNYQSSESRNARANPESATHFCEQRPLRAWMVANDLPSLDGVTYSGIFAVSREHVHHRPRRFYENLIAYLDTHSNPEAGHFLERTWMSVFHPIPPECRYSKKS